MMREAFIVSTALAPMAKAYRGMTGARLAGPVLLEGKRCGARYREMCIGGGMGAAGLFKI